jgi:hypothetical protein
VSPTILVLSGVQVQPQRGQDLGHQPAGLLGLLSRSAQDDEVVAVPDEHPEAAALPRPFRIQHVEREVGQQRGDDSSHAVGNFEFEVALPYKRGERPRPTI